MSLRSPNDQDWSERNAAECHARMSRFEASAIAGRALGSTNAQCLRLGFEEGWKAATEGAWKGAGDARTV